MQAGGHGIAVQVDHLQPAQVADLAQRIDAEQGQLDVLVNDIWGGELLVEWDTPLWQQDLDKGLRLLRLAIDTHLITTHYALPLLIRRPGGLLVASRRHRRLQFVQVSTFDFLQLGQKFDHSVGIFQGHELAPHDCTAVALIPGWLRSEMMLEHVGVSEVNWRDEEDTHFATISESRSFVGRAVAALAADQQVHRRNGGSFPSGGLAAEYGFTDLTAPARTAGDTSSRFKSRADPRKQAITVDRHVAPVGGARYVGIVD